MATTQSIQTPFTAAVMDDEDMIRIMDALAHNGDSVQRYQQVFQMAQQSQTPATTCQPTGAFGG